MIFRFKQDKNKLFLSIQLEDDKSNGSILKEYAEIDDEGLLKTFSATNHCLEITSSFENRRVFDERTMKIILEYFLNKKLLDGLIEDKVITEYRKLTKSGELKTTLYSSSYVSLERRGKIPLLLKNFYEAISDRVFGHPKIPDVKEALEIVKNSGFDPNPPELIKADPFHGHAFEAPLMALAHMVGQHSVGKSDLEKGIVEEIFSILINKGAKINISHEDGVTPLHELAHSNHYNLIELLIKNGANINLRDEEERTALDIAEDYTVGDDDRIIQILTPKPKFETTKDKINYSLGLYESSKGERKDSSSLKNMDDGKSIAESRRMK